MRKMFIVLIGLMIVSGLLMLACQKQEPETKAVHDEQPAKAGGYGGAEVQAIEEKAKEAAGAYGEKAKEVVSGYGEKAQDAVAGYGEKAQDAAQDAVQDAADKAKQGIGGYGR